MCGLVNWSFQEDIFSDLFKTAEIIPVFKKGDRLRLNKYRPVSKLLPISKILQKIASQKIINFINKHEVIHPARHSFVSDKSAITAIMKFLSPVYEGVDNRKKFIDFFMDLSKAVDIVDHSLLLSKLFNYGLRNDYA